MTEPVVTVTPAGPEDRELVARLLQLYLHDLSDFNANKPSDEGIFLYSYFDAYWADPPQPDRHAFLIRAGDRLAGFAFVRDLPGGSREMAEFFILRAWRRDHIGAKAAVQIFRSMPGEWQLTVLPRNTGARAFWERMIRTVAVEWAAGESPIMVKHQFKVPATAP